VAELFRARPLAGSAEAGPVQATSAIKDTSMTDDSSYRPAGAHDDAALSGMSAPHQRVTMGMHGPQGPAQDQHPSPGATSSTTVHGQEDSVDPLQDDAHADRTGTRYPPAGLLPTYRRLRLSIRSTKHSRNTSGAEAVRRSERRTARRRRARVTGGWLAARLWWVTRGIGITARALWRTAWDPDREAYIVAMLDGDNPDGAHRARIKLRRDRRHSIVVILVTTSGTYVAIEYWGHDLWAVVPWWAPPAAAAVALPLLALAGRPGQPDKAPEALAGVMPQSLTLGDSARGVARTLTEAFANVKIRAEINDGGVLAEPGGWGWTVTLQLLDNITEPKLEALERHLNTPAGGLVFSRVPQAARVMILRIVMKDLLANPVDAPERPLGSVRDHIAMATRFDGGRLSLELFARHVLIIGRTGSGKSGVLHDFLDALTASSDVNIDGIDLSDGPDLKSWKKSLRDHALGPDIDKAEQILTAAVRLIQHNTARLGSRNFDPVAGGPGHVVVIDEYGMVAAIDTLRVLVEFIVTYGAKAGVWVVLANQRAVNDMMGTSRLASQVHIKVFLGMSAEDAQGLPKHLRELGVRPHLFRQATQTDPHDAGKGFVVDVETTPILVRFDRMGRLTAVRRASERAPHRPQLSPEYAAVLHQDDGHGVSELLLAVRSAVLAISSTEGRRPERASGDEITQRLRQRGYAVGKTNLVGELRRATGGLIDRSRDTNLPSGKNPKGFYLEDLDRAITQLERRAAHDNPDGGRSSDH
jgi:hypothetical protein